MTIAKRVGIEVARARKSTLDEDGRRMTAQALADRCSGLGHPLDRTVIAKLEKGIRQTVTVADLLVLARALDLPPLALVFPVGYEQEVAVLPGRSEHPVTGLRWASGEGVLPARTEDDRKSFARWRDSAIFWIRKFMKDDETIRYNKQRAKDHWLRAGQADSANARAAHEQMAQTAEDQVRDQEQIVARWRGEVEESHGITAAVPQLYGEVPGNLIASPGGERSNW